LTGIADRVVALLLRPFLRARLRRYEALAEAAYSAMYEARPPAAKDCYDDARLNLGRAIDMARRAGYAGEVARLTARRGEIAEVYDRQFRRVGYN
jgi:hypothetical protein